jgi:hypothetical protein
MGAGAYESDYLQTLNPDLSVPKTRMRNAQAVQDFFRRCIDDDMLRSHKRARVNGLVDGNPPYRRQDLLKANRADACNVNWNISRSYLEAATGAFYDLYTQAPGFFSIKTSFGKTDQEKEQSSRILSEEADRIISLDPVWDYQMQQSIWNMVLHGCGPLLFEDAFKILPRAFACGDLKVPEFTYSDTYYWEVGGVQCVYYPPELYAFIEDEEAATSIGWDVEYTKEVIKNAMDIRQTAGIQYEWEMYQQELKNNTLAYYDNSKICRLVHVLYKEFDGRITQAIVERDSVSGTQIGFLFRSIGRYSNFREVIHPMYFDRGNGGYHHSVTGLGVKMFGAMEYQNRLLCNLVDKTFAPKTLFRPTTAEGSTRFQLAHHGDYALLPPGYDAVQSPITGLLTESLTMNQEITNILESNLSSYRQQMPVQEKGNPPTKFQKQVEASQQSALSNTTFNRFYRQLDMLYTEVARRMCNLNSCDERANEYQERCRKRGVPRECFGRIEKVEAVRVVGQGSTFMRKMAVDGITPIVGSLPEDGRQNWLNDKIAAEAGQHAVSRYNPPQQQQRLATDQQAEALQWVAAMKVGVPPVVTSSQNAITYASTFLAAGVQALQSVQQGADPLEVLKFLGICGPAIHAHLQRFANDPTRKMAYDTMNQQWMQLAKLTDQLKAMVAKKQQQGVRQQVKTQQAMTDEQLKNMQVQADIQRKNARNQTQLQIMQSKAANQRALTQQQMALEDASTAAEIHRKHMQAFSE